MDTPNENANGADRPDESKRERWHRRRSMQHNGAMGGAYFVAFIGALVYYIQQSTSFGEGLLGFLKACVWPAMVVYHLMGHLGM